MMTNFFYIKIFLTVAVLIICLPANSFAQWVNDPSSNTKLVTDPVDPVNISALRDLNGGAFIFWEDKKGSPETDVYFIHFDKNGAVSFRSDGKTVSTRVGRKTNPISDIGPLGNAFVLWKGFGKNKNPELFIQKLSKNGMRLWQNDGLQLTNSKLDETDYSFRVDKSGYVYSSYIVRQSGITSNYSVGYQVINSGGKLLKDSSEAIVYNSNSKISDTKILSDNKGSAYIFWLENQNQKTVLFAQSIDSSGTKKWGSKPVVISKKGKDVLGYSLDKAGNSIYTVITYGGKSKAIYHNLISDKGKLVWGSDGKLLTYQKGSQSNPQFVFADSSVVVTWTNEFEKTKDVFIQSFDVKGNPLWGKNGKRIIDIKGNQFGQKIVYEQKGGVIVAWIEKRKDVPDANLFIQKVDLQGNIIWDSTGVLISSSQNTQKSYLNLVSDNEGGAVAIFKGTVNNKTDIYGQKIFSTGTYASQILALDAQLVNDSVKVTWYAANENDGTTYDVYRTDEAGLKRNDWKLAGTLEKANSKKVSYYEFADLPDSKGSVFYRVAQSYRNSTIQISDVKRIELSMDVESITVGQNYPNPFSGSTTINFFLPEETKVTIEIFNSDIEMIKKVEDRSYPAGKNSYVFNAKGLQPGIYYYKIKTQNFADVKKMVVSK